MEQAVVGVDVGVGGRSVSVVDCAEAQEARALGRAEQQYAGRFIWLG